MKFKIPTFLLVISSTIIFHFSSQLEHLLILFNILFLKVSSGIRDKNFFWATGVRSKSCPSIQISKKLFLIKLTALLKKLEIFFYN